MEVWGLRLNTQRARVSCTPAGKKGIFNASVPGPTQGDSAVEGNVEEVRQYFPFCSRSHKVWIEENK